MKANSMGDLNALKKYGIKVLTQREKYKQVPRILKRRRITEKQRKQFIEERMK